MEVKSAQGRELEVGRRHLEMLRRATLEHFFSTAQIKKILKIIPARFHADAIVIIWNQVTDIECIKYDELLDAEAIAKVQHRIGGANMFNPYQPNMRYSLNLKVRRHTQPLCALSDELVAKTRVVQRKVHWGADDSRLSRPVDEY